VLAGILPADEGHVRSALAKVGMSASPGVEPLDVADLGKRQPRVIACDVDRLAIDPLEFLRQLRFVLPETIIVAITGTVSTAWAVSCHLAGVTCMLCTGSSQAQIVTGLRDALLSGCYTDPRFEAAGGTGTGSRAKPVGE
jgi:DNA-binding NarL/FixJ family response regulator